VEESGLDELEVEEGGQRIRISKNQHNSTPYVTSIPAPTQFTIAPSQQGVSGTADRPGVSTEAPPEAGTAAGKSYHEVRSPIVGTFYRAPAPDAEPYVEFGSKVEVGAVLCIIEAMKLMNEIESDVAGRVVKIAVENGQPVEYNQTLFLIEPT
ncbi:MAG TPA: acetyl-CoA carboxylase biotin carboxyl carrier protein, partial [Bacteroidota bacterium]